MGHLAGQGGQAGGGVRVRDIWGSALWERLGLELDVRQMSRMSFAIYHTCHLPKLTQGLGVGAVLVPTSWIGKLRLRKRKSPAQGHTQVQGGPGIEPRLIGKPEPFLFSSLNSKKN